MKKSLCGLLIGLASLTAKADLPSEVAQALNQAGVPLEQVAVVVQAVEQEQIAAAVAVQQTNILVRAAQQKGWVVQVAAEQVHLVQAVQMVVLTQVVVVVVETVEEAKTWVQEMAVQE